MENRLPQTTSRPITRKLGVFVGLVLLAALIDLTPTTCITDSGRRDRSTVRDKARGRELPPEPAQPARLPTVAALEVRPVLRTPAAEQAASIPEYDPVALSMNGSESPMEIMEMETRDPSFAVPREALLRRLVSERLRDRLPYGVALFVGCQSSSCEVIVQGESSDDDLNLALQAINVSDLCEASGVGPMAVSNEPHRPGISIVLLYSPKLREHAAYERWLQEHRQVENTQTEPQPSTTRRTKATVHD